jgi:hypothetical protein
MSIYKELLQSFQRVHGRNLTLLEQDQEQSNGSPEEAARVLASIFTPNVIDKSDPNKPIQINFTNPSTGKSYPLTLTANRDKVAVGNLGWVLWDMTTGSISATKNTPGAQNSLKKAITALAGSGEVGRKTLTPEEQKQRTEQELISNTIENVDMDSSEDQEAFNQRLQRCLKADIDGSMRQNIINIVKSLGSAYSKLVQEDDGSWVVKNESHTAADTLLMMGVIQDIMEGNKESCDSVKYGSEGELIIGSLVIGRDSRMGLNFKEKSQGLCEDIETIDIVADNAENSLSNVRGKLNEKAQAFAAFVNLVRKNLGNMTSEQKKEAMDAIKRKKAAIVRDVQTLRESNEKWVQRASDTITPLEDHALFEFIRTTALNPEEEASIAAVLRISNLVTDITNADYVLEVGEQVGGGQRQDTFDIWFNGDSARDALRPFGNSLGELVEVPVSVAFAGKDKELQELVSLGLVDSEGSVFMTESSLKIALHSTGSVKTGTGTDSDIDDHHKGNTELGRAFNRLSGRSKWPEGIKSSYDKVHQRQMQIRKDVGKLITKAKTKIGGKNVTTNPLGTAIQSVLDDSSLNLSFKEFMNDADFKSLKTVQKKMNRSGVSPAEISKLEKQAKNLLIEITTKKAIIQDFEKAKSENDDDYMKAIAMYSLSNIFKAGGSSRPKTNLRVTTADNLQMICGSQNGAIKSIIKEILSGRATLDDRNLPVKEREGYWRLDISKGNPGFRHPRKRGVVVRGILKDGTWSAHESMDSCRERGRVIDLTSGDTVKKLNNSISLKGSPGQILMALNELFSVITKKIGII